MKKVLFGILTVVFFWTTLVVPVMAGEDQPKSWQEKALSGAESAKEKAVEVKEETGTAAPALAQTPEQVQATANDSLDDVVIVPDQDQQLAADVKAAIVEAQTARNLVQPVVAAPAPEPELKFEAPAKEVLPEVKVMDLPPPGFAYKQTKVKRSATVIDIDHREISNLNSPTVEPTPVYKTWWFWTIIGVVVAGAATTAGVCGSGYCTGTIHVSQR